MLPKLPQTTPKLIRRLLRAKLLVVLAIAALIWHTGSLQVTAATTGVAIDSDLSGQIASKSVMPLTTTAAITSTQQATINPNDEAGVCPPVETDETFSSPRLLAGRFLKSTNRLVKRLWPASVLTERTNILLLGSDTRPGQDAGRADTMILVTIDPATKTAGMLSIPRDLWVTIPGHGDHRLNAAFPLGERQGHPGGGPALTMETIRANLGIPVDHYVLVEFEGFKQIIDTLGGIDLCVPETIDAATYYGYVPQAVNKTGYYSFVPVEPAEVGQAVDSGESGRGYEFLYIEAGPHTLDGYTALRYARSRASTEADFGRIQRQQAVVLAIRDKALRLEMLPKAPDLWERMGHILDTDLELADILQLAQLAYEIPLTNIQTAAIDQELTMAHTTERGAQVLLPRRAEIKLLIEEMFGPTQPTATPTRAELGEADIEPVFNGIRPVDQRRN